VITSVQRRRRCPTAEKIRLVEETIQPGMSVSYVARRAGVARRLLFNWRRRMLEGGLQAVEADEDAVGRSRVRELERRVRELERLLGRKTMEVDILKETLDVARLKKPSLQLAIMERSQGRFAMKAVADTLAVARSNLIERVSRRATAAKDPDSRPRVRRRNA
jgi:transposase